LRSYGGRRLGGAADSGGDLSGGSEKSDLTDVLFASKQPASFSSKKKDLMSEKSEKSDLSLLRIGCLP
jgi:hypothetical protein